MSSETDIRGEFLVQHTNLQFAVAAYQHTISVQLEGIETGRSWSDEAKGERRSAVERLHDILR